jgi:manganese/iron transport system permease protein
MNFETLILPFQYEFMQNAFLIALIVSIPSALLSCFLVMKGWALMGDAISHAVLPGIVFAYIIGAPLDPWCICCRHRMFACYRLFIK